MSLPSRVPSSFASMRSQWKRRIFLPASASGSSARTPGAFFFLRADLVGASSSLASARSNLDFDWALSLYGSSAAADGAGDRPSCRSP